jgi:Leucine-rich repeat (LRR) protein
MNEINISNMLPEEMLEKVFLKLPPRDLKATVLVCRRWREVGEGPGLWDWTWLNNKDLSSMPGMLDTSRLENVRRLKIFQDANSIVAGRTMSAKLLQAVGINSGLREVHLGGLNLSNLAPVLLASVVSKVERAVLWYTRLTGKQVEAILAGIDNDNRLKKLNMNDNDLSTVDPDLMARGFLKVHELKISGSSFTGQQMESILSGITGCKYLSLKKLNVDRTNLCPVAADLLSKAINKLEDVDIQRTNLTGRQTQEIFAGIIKNSSLKKLRIGYNSLNADSDLLAIAVCRLEEADLLYAHLSYQQVDKLFAALSKESPLKKLDIGGNALINVEPGVLARAVNKRRVVKMVRTGLKMQQVSAILEQSLAGSSLEALDLGQENINREHVDYRVPVDKELVARARMAIGILT